MTTIVVALEMAFGVPAGTKPDEEDWVDITGWVDADDSSVLLETIAGRGSARDGITPGRLSQCVLLNADRRFDPRNTEGPWFGQLVDGVPTRVRVGVVGDGDGDGASLYDIALFDVDLYDVSGGGALVPPVPRWTGVVAGGFPQDLTQFDPTLELRAQDMLGWINQAKAPASAFEAEVAVLSAPVAWWRVGATGWVDRVTARSARHTGGLTQTDSLIDGGDQPFRSNGYGHGVVESGPFLDGSGSGELHVVSMMVQLDADVTSGVVDLYRQFDSTGVDQFLLWVEPTARQVVAYVSRTGEDQQSIQATRTLLFDGKVHHLAVVFGWDVTVAGEALDFWGDIYIDGRSVRTALLPASALDEPASNTGAGALLAGGPAGDGYSVRSELSGVVDHLILWQDIEWDHTVVFPELAAAARLAWAGDALHERWARIVESVGAGDFLAEPDVSGIVTHQGYRPSGPLALLNAIEQTEQGHISADRNGMLRYSNRSAWLTDERSTTVQVTFSDVAELLDAEDDPACEMVEDGTSIADRPEDLVLRAEVTSANGRMQSADAAPELAGLYGPQSPLTLSGLLHGNDLRSKAIAEALVFFQSQPKPRAEITFDPTSRPGILIPFALEVEEGDLVRVIKAPATTCDGADIGDPVELLGHVITIRNRWWLHRWLVTLTLDTTRPGYTWFTPGVSEIGDGSLVAF